MKYLFFDTETSGLPKNWKADVTDTNNWPRLVQLAYIIVTDEISIGEWDDDLGYKVLKEYNNLIIPEGFTIDPMVTKVHGISHANAVERGIKLSEAIDEFLEDCYGSNTLVAHNMAFDEKIIGAELIRLEINRDFNIIKKICTMKSSTNYCKIPGPYGYKWPKLNEIYYLLFNKQLENAHNALYDVRATVEVFFKLKEIGVIK